MLIYIRIQVDSLTFLLDVEILVIIDVLRQNIFNLLIVLFDFFMIIIN